MVPCDGRPAKVERFILDAISRLPTVQDTQAFKKLNCKA